MIVAEGAVVDLGKLGHAIVVILEGGGSDELAVLPHAKELDLGTVLATDLGHGRGLLEVALVVREAEVVELLG